MKFDEKYKEQTIKWFEEFKKGPTLLPDYNMSIGLNITKEEEALSKWAKNKLTMKFINAHCTMMGISLNNGPKLLLSTIHSDFHYIEVYLAALAIQQLLEEKPGAITLEDLRRLCNKGFYREEDLQRLWTLQKLEVGNLLNMAFVV